MLPSNRLFNVAILRRLDAEVRSRCLALGMGAFIFHKVSFFFLRTSKYFCHHA